MPRVMVASAGGPTSCKKLVKSEEGNEAQKAGDARAGSS